MKLWNNIPQMGLSYQEVFSMWNGQMKSLHDIMDHINYGSEQFEDISSRQGRGGPRCLCFGNGRAGGAYAILYLFSQCPPPFSLMWLTDCKKALQHWSFKSILVSCLLPRRLHIRCCLIQAWRVSKRQGLFSYILQFFLCRVIGTKVFRFND